MSFLRSWGCIDDLLYDFEVSEEGLGAHFGDHFDELELLGCPGMLWGCPGRSKGDFEGFLEPFWVPQGSLKIDFFLKSKKKEDEVPFLCIYP